MKGCTTYGLRILKHKSHHPTDRTQQNKKHLGPKRLYGAATIILVMILGGSSAPSYPLTAQEQSSPTIARLRYDGGGDWYANPSSLENLLAAIYDRTGIAVSNRSTNVGASDPDLSDNPYLYATGHGNMAFSDLELDRLREYLYRGGFLHVDDNYGLDESFRREIARLFPTIPLSEVPLEHPVYQIFYKFPEGLPKIHEHDGKPAQAFGIFINGRLAVFYSYESDLGDGWEDSGVHEDPEQLREKATQMGVNLFLYALSSTTTP